MKNFIYLFYITFLTLCSCKTQGLQNNNAKYLNAYELLSKEDHFREKGINVVDTLFYIPQIIKFEKLKKQNNLIYNKRILDSLEKVDEENLHEKIYSYEVAILKKNNKKALYNLYFSKLFDDELFVEIVNNKNNIVNSHKFLTYFGVSYIYTFKFDKSGKIITMDKIEYINN